MGTLWALVANSSWAQIYEIKGHGKHIKMIRQIDNPDGRKKSGEIYSDRPGRAFDRVGIGRHAMSSETDFRLKEQEVFARKLAIILEKGREENAFDQFALVAPPQFLGQLNLVIGTDHPLKKFLTNSIEKDLTDSFKQEDIINHLCKYLDLWNR